MANKLIARLGELAHLTPDEIVKKISLPLSKWRRLNTFTQDEYYALVASGIYVTMFNTRDEHYLGMNQFFPDRYYQTVNHWSYSTFSTQTRSNRHWYVINNECAQPFRMGIDNVEADQEAD